MLFKASVLAALASYIVSVAAHGHVTEVRFNGEKHPGGSPEWFYKQELPDRAGWYALNQDNGFVDPPTYNTDEIICHKSGKPGTSHIKVAAGTTLELQWVQWPESHHGPILDYLAACNGDCTKVDKTKLSFAKIQETGLISPAYWATSKLLDDDQVAKVTIPKNIKAGNYVLRHEIIALHSANNVNEAQNYPSCFNLEITGDGTDVPSGYAGTDLYAADDAGIHYNIYNGGDQKDYPIPGPELWEGLGGSSGGDDEC